MSREGITDIQTSSFRGKHSGAYRAGLTLPPQGWVTESGDDFLVLLPVMSHFALAAADGFS